LAVTLFMGIEPADELEHQSRFPGMISQRFEELAPGVSPAADPGKSGGPGMAAVGLVAVGLQQATVAFQQGRKFAMPAAQPPVEDDIAPRATDDPQPSLLGF